MRRQSPNPADRPVIEAYERRDGEALELAIARAFERVGVDVMEQSPLQEAVNVDALRALYETPHSAPIRTTIVLYDHPVTITDEGVLIHEPSSE